MPAPYRALFMLIDYGRVGVSVECQLLDAYLVHKLTMNRSIVRWLDT